MALTKNYSGRGLVPWCVKNLQILERQAERDIAEARKEYLSQSPITKEDYFLIDIARLDDIIGCPFSKSRDVVSAIRERSRMLGRDHKTLIIDDKTEALQQFHDNQQKLLSNPKIVEMMLAADEHDDTTNIPDPIQQSGVESSSEQDLPAPPTRPIDAAKISGIVDEHTLQGNDS